MRSIARGMAAGAAMLVCVYSMVAITMARTHHVTHHASMLETEFLQTHPWYMLHASISAGIAFVLFVAYRVLKGK